jgi:hypothetical protein
MWFSARLAFESEVSDGDDSPPLCEENIKLVEAENEDEARQKAFVIGQNDQIEYANSDGATVRWRFVRVVEIPNLCESELYDGVEVYPRLFWKSQQSGEVGGSNSGSGPL